MFTSFNADGQNMASLDVRTNESSPYYLKLGYWEKSALRFAFVITEFDCIFILRLYRAYQAQQ